MRKVRAGSYFFVLYLERDQSMEELSTLDLVLSNRFSSVYDIHHTHFFLHRCLLKYTSTDWHNDIYCTEQTHERTFDGLYNIRRDLIYHCTSVPFPTVQVVSEGSSSVERRGIFLTLRNTVSDCAGRRISL